jgi:hypothetical protein
MRSSSAPSSSRLQPDKRRAAGSFAGERSGTSHRLPSVFGPLVSLPTGGTRRFRLKQSALVGTCGPANLRRRLRARYAGGVEGSREPLVAEPPRVLVRLPHLENAPAIPRLATLRGCRRTQRPWLPLVEGVDVEVANGLPRREEGPPQRAFFACTARSASSQVARLATAAHSVPRHPGWAARWTEPRSRCRAGRRDRGATRACPS